MPLPGTGFSGSGHKREANQPTTVARTSSSGIQSTTVFDGLGRVCESRLSESDGLIRTRTEYDPLGRVSKVTNPYHVATATTLNRCGNLAGEVFTQTSYDGLGRPLSIAAPDSSVTTSTYLGEITTVIDAASAQKQLYSDALGRLQRVVEDPGTSGLAYNTYYQYDGLNNLRGVCPGAAFTIGGCTTEPKRTFYFDTLSRLRRADNPESAPVKYTYDGNGNISTRNDDRNYTTTYTYDALDRPTAKSYNSGDTPVGFCYDSHSNCGGSTVANGIGRLIVTSN